MSDGLGREGSGNILNKRKTGITLPREIEGTIEGRWGKGSEG